MRPTLSGFVFQETGSAHDLEDRFACDWQAGIIAVADGVTRPNYDSQALSESCRVSTIANEFCRIALELLSKINHEGMAARIQHVGKIANQGIAALNRSFGYNSDTDYVLRDPFGCVGSCGALDDSGLWHFGHIGDCGLVLFGADGMRTNLTQNQLVGTLRVLASLSSLDLSEQQRFTRTHLRNRAEARDSDGQTCGYGVLNGDTRAEAWWTTGTVPVHRGDIAVAYSDGAERFIEHAEFETILHGFRETRQAQDAENACRELWRRESSRSAFPVDDATLVAALVPGSR